MCHLTCSLWSFLFRRKVMFLSQDIQVFVFFTIPWFTKSVTSWRVLVHETRCIFEYIFWTISHQTRLIDRCKQGQQVSGIFWKIWRIGAKLQVLFNLATCSEYPITNYVKFPFFLCSIVFLFFCCCFFWKDE